MIDFKHVFLVLVDLGKVRSTGISQNNAFGSLKKDVCRRGFFFFPTNADVLRWRNGKLSNVKLLQYIALKKCLLSIIVTR